MDTPTHTGTDMKSDPRTRFQPLIRTARLIHRQLAAETTTQLGELRSRLTYLNDEFVELDRIRRNLRNCEQNGWLVAGLRVQQDTLRFVEEIRTRLDHIAEHAKPRQSEMTLIPALADIVRELQQIGDEFDAWSFDESSKELTVVTDNITLEGVDLGVFDIVLHINRLSGSSNRAFTVEAQDPNRPTGNDAISHPHISDDALCAGEAVAPIRRALADGRFTDFFLLVKGVIETYNPSSAYVKLEHWTGTLCHDCGDRTGDDNIYFCNNCEHDYCDNCISSCETCSESRCHGCLSTCARCDISVCESCRGYCNACRAKCCLKCLDEDGLCTECAVPEQDDANPNSPDVNEVSPTPTTVETRDEATTTASTQSV